MMVVSKECIACRWHKIGFSKHGKIISWCTKGEEPIPAWFISTNCPHAKKKRKKHLIGEERINNMVKEMMSGVEFRHTKKDYFINAADHLAMLIRLRNIFEENEQ